MATKKIQAKNVREAMALIKETFGSDAIILSSKDIADGIEFIVTDDFHAQANSVDAITKSSTRAVVDNLVVDLKAPSEIAIKSLQQEFESLKNLIQEQLSELVWEKKKRLYPIQALAVRKLIQLGFSAEVASRFSYDLASDQPVNAAWKIIKNKIISALPVDLICTSMRAGIFMMLGTSGVGKTTVIAKLAAQHALKFGTHNIAIISTDTTKIGATESLKIYSNILNVPIRVVENAQQMSDALHDFKKKQLILIDTASVVPTDNIGLQATIDMLPEACRAEKLLIVPANMQTHDLERVIEFYQAVNISGCVVTKIDEAITCGGILSATINLQLPICYLSTGPKIPDDISIFSAAKFVGQILNLTVQDEIDESFIARSFAQARVNAF